MREASDPDDLGDTLVNQHPAGHVSESISPHM